MNFRAYHFGNFYLSSIQQGIQTAHCQTNMALKYHSQTTKAASKAFWEWTKNPTTICLNGGNLKTMEDTLSSIVDVFHSMKDKGQHIYPCDIFSEDKESLGSMLTNIGIILPEKVWSAMVKLQPAMTRLGFSSLADMIDSHLNKDANISEVADYVSTYKDFSVEDAILADIISSHQLAQ